MAESANRTEAARSAAETLLQDGRGGPQNGLRNNYATRNASEVGTRRRMARVCCGLMSDVRRTFCLMVTFDLILVFVLWGIFVQMKLPTSTNETLPTCNSSNSGDEVMHFCDEVMHFNFYTSLFDVAMCGVGRFLLLVIAYGLLRLRNPSVIAITTFVTSLYVIIKVFTFDFKRENNPPSYLLLISSFIMAWVETWFLDFRVLPHENSSATLRSESGRQTGERASLLGGRGEDSDFGTPEEGSDNEVDEERLHGQHGYGSINSDYHRKVEDAWAQARHLLNSSSGWKREKSVGDIIVHSQNSNHFGKVFKIEAMINANARDVFEVTTIKFTDIPKWNSTVLESRVLQTLGPSMDIVYSVTAPAGKGVVSSRDFVSVRQWKQTETGGVLAAGCAVNCVQMPVQSQHVRGENRISGWMFEPISDNPNQCLLRMVNATDIKGWIPQVVVDQALTGVLMESIENLRRYISRQS